MRGTVAKRLRRMARAALKSGNPWTVRAYRSAKRAWTRMPWPKRAEWSREGYGW
jgi:hypothetical protein